MTEITYINNLNEFTLKVEGHSNYAESGKDIACAGVSTLVVTLAIMIEKNSDKLFMPEQIRIQDGYAFICAFPKEKYHKEFEIMFSMVMQGFEWLSKEFEENIKICI